MIRENQKSTCFVAWLTLPVHVLVSLWISASVSWHGMKCSSTLEQTTAYKEHSYFEPAPRICIHFRNTFVRYEFGLDLQSLLHLVLVLVHAFDCLLQAAWVNTRVCPCLCAQMTHALSCLTVCCRHVLASVALDFGAVIFCAFAILRIFVSMRRLFGNTLTRSIIWEY